MFVFSNIFITFVYIYIYIYIYTHVYVCYEGQLKNLVDTYFVFTFIEAKCFYLPITLKAVKTITSITSNGNWNCVFFGKVRIMVTRKYIFLHSSVLLKFQSHRYLLTVIAGNQQMKAICFPIKSLKYKRQGGNAYWRILASVRFK